MKKKVILITGCARGLGFSLALRLSRQGHIVYATVRNLKKARNILDKERSIPSLLVRQMDITNNKEILDVSEEIKKNEKKIDVMILNAAYILFGPIECIEIEQAQKQFDVNLFGSLRVIQALLPLMRKRKQGFIIFMGSTSGVHCSAMYGLYSATKFALEAIAYSLAVNLFPWNIFVSLIENSGTRTSICEKSLEIGSYFDKKTNPYKDYVINSLKFLKKIIRKGENPDTIARFISNILSESIPNFRYFPTLKSKNIFKKHLKDPLSKNWLKEAKYENKIFYKKKEYKNGI